MLLFANNHNYLTPNEDVINFFLRNDSLMHRIKILTNNKHFVCLISYFIIFQLLSPSCLAKGITDLFATGNESHKYNKAESISLYSVSQRKDSFAACLDQFPGRKAIEQTIVSTNIRPIALCSDSFAVLYSQTSKTPLVVAERLTAKQIRAAKGEQRTNQFFPDPRISKKWRAELEDYQGQIPAVDRGHMAPAGNAPDANAMAQSFSLSNVVPQDPGNNRKSWAKIESDVRKFVQRAKGNVFVFTGPVFDEGHQTVGRNRVWKPTRLFKLVYDEAEGRAWAYVLLNAEARIERPMNYKEFVKATGLPLLKNATISGSER